MFYPALNGPENVNRTPGVKEHKVNRAIDRGAIGLTLDVRRRQIVRAAETIFLSKGYYCAKMDDIAECAGMSKRTIYQMFASKEALFEALLIERMAPTGRTKLNVSSPPEQAIGKIVLDAALWVLSPEAIAITRLIVGEYSRSPKLARLLKHQGYRRFSVSLEKCLESLATTGNYKFDDLQEAAKMLFGMVLGDLHYDLLLGLRQSVSKATIKRRVTSATAIFLTGRTSYRGSTIS